MALNFTPADVQAARRELAQRNFSDFACLVDIPTVPLSDEADEDSFSVMRLGTLAAHHKLLCYDLQGIERGFIPNLMVLMPPGSAKSTYSDVLFVPWFMAKRKRRNVILASYASEIAEKQGRRARQLVGSRSFANLMGVGLRADNRAAHQWTLENGSEFMAGGLLSGITGNRAALGIIDDPMKGRAEAESETLREKTWNAYIDDFCSRLIPGAPQVLVQCMVGSTRVLMADGAEKALRDVRPGDAIATFEDGRLAASKILNWANQGPDFVLRIRTKSGTIVEANERHPFLVERNGVQTWQRIQDLKIGDQMLRAVRGEASSAPSMGAQSLSRAKACADRTTTSTSGPRGIARRLSTLFLATRQRSSTATASRPTNFTRWLLRKAAAALSAASHQVKTFAHTGAASSASTTITPPAKCARCSATIATSWSATEKRPTCLCELLSTYAITLDPIERIEIVGREDVFDIQVERTENFIANGLVSHNTRWHEDDIAGRILPEGWDGESGLFDGRDGRRWKVICLPAVADRADDPLGRALGETLWPEWFSHEHWAPFKANPRTWSSLYQQKPSPQEGTYFQREWFAKRWKTIPKHLSIYGTSDYAVTEGGGDYTVHRVWGVDAAGNLLRLDGWRGQTTADEWIERKLDLIKQWKPIAWFGESGVIRRSIEPMLKRRMHERGVYCRMEWITRNSDKTTSARGFQARAAMGKVLFEPTADIDEHLKFPAGKHDDDVDCSALMGMALDEAHPAIIPPKEQKKFVDSWDRAFNEERDSEANGWKLA